MDSTKQAEGTTGAASPAACMPTALQMLKLNASSLFSMFACTISAQAVCCAGMVLASRFVLQAAWQ